MKDKTGSVAALDSTLMSCRAKSSVVTDEASMQKQMDSMENAVLAAINEYKNLNSTGLAANVNEPRILGGCGGTPDTRYPTAAGKINLI